MAANTTNLIEVVGTPHSIFMDVESTTVIYVGDIVCASSATASNAVTANDLADAGSAGANRAAVANRFVGISNSYSPSGSTTPIEVYIAPTQLRLKLQTATSTPPLTELEPYCAATNSATPNNQVVAGATAPIAFAFRLNDDATSKAYAQLLPSKLISAQAGT